MMPQKYQELKKSFDKVVEKICQCHAPTDRKEVEKYLLSMTLRIWYSNTHYANEYGEAMRAIQEKSYTMEQIATAMVCCGEEIRGLRTPTFLKEILVVV